MDKRKIIKGDRGNFYWINIYINRKNIDGILLKYFLSILKKHPSYMLMDIEIKKKRQRFIFNKRS